VRSIKFYYKPYHNGSIDWVLFSTEAYHEDFMSAADRRLQELREANQNFNWKMETVKPTYRYRIMVQPLWNNSIEWFPIYKNRTYMYRNLAAQVTDKLRGENPQFKFIVNEEEVVD